MTTKACKNCKRLTDEATCPVCGSTEMSKRWVGLVIITDPSRSKVAERLGIKEKGRYALEVR